MLVNKEVKNNVTWFEGYVKRGERETLHNHKAAVIWFTGLSASGKSTIAKCLERQLYEMGCSTYVFDGDNVRHGICSDLSFSKEDRNENIRRIGEMVKLFMDAGIIAITAFISPYRQDRKKVRALLPDRRFIEIFVDCPLDVCAERDSKGLYEKAKAGIVKEFTGISAPYEAPENPELIIRSDKDSPLEAVKRIIALLEQHGII